MIDDSGTHKVKLEDLKNSMNAEPKEGFSKDEIDSIADLINDGPQTDLNFDPEDTGRFTR
jgi:hypothetical protein